MSQTPVISLSVAIRDPDSTTHALKPNADGSLSVGPSGGGKYATVAASQTNQILGTIGAIGDYLGSLTVVVATPATAQVQIKDGANAAITVFPNSPGGGISTYTVPINAKSISGAWQVTTGAGVSVIATGNFT
jgi:hypothetical protein